MLLSCRAFFLTAFLSVSIAACSPGETPPTDDIDIEQAGDDKQAHDETYQFVLQPNPDVQSLLLTGTVEPTEELELSLATPSEEPPETAHPEQTEPEENTFTLTVNDDKAHYPAQLQQVPQGPDRFEVAVPVNNLPIENVQLVESDSGQPSIYHVSNGDLSEADNIAALLDETELAVKDDELCLTWPADQFAQATLIRVQDGHRRVQFQTTEPTRCVAFKPEGADIPSEHIDKDVVDSTQWIINLRNPLSAVQLITTGSTTE